MEKKKKGKGTFKNAKPKTISKISIRLDITLTTQPQTPKENEGTHENFLIKNECLKSCIRVN